jgi:hypothetical protein
MRLAIRSLVLVVAVLALSSVASAQHAAVSMRQTRANGQPSTSPDPQPFPQPLSIKRTIPVTSGNPTEVRVTGDIRLLELLVAVHQKPRK